LALGRGLCAGPAVPCGLCRELPLGTGCAESIGACAERSLLSAKPQIPVVGPCRRASMADKEAERREVGGARRKE
jgi:hypothetical protein